MSIAPLPDSRSAPDPELQEMLRLADRLAQEASRIILPHFRSCGAKLKPDGSEVTIADLQAEAAMRAILERECPSHRVLGEEFGGEASPDGYTWVIDPIDGTTYFALGMPLFGTLVGLLYAGEPVAGVVRLPAQGETLLAAKGAGCLRRVDGEPPHPVSTSTDKPLSAAFCSAAGLHSTDLATGDPRDLALGDLVRKAGKFRFLGDCQQHVLVCRGAVDLAIDTIMQPWDIAAIVPCIREAGGVATSLTGTAEGVVFSGSLVSACGPTLHGEALLTLAAAAGRGTLIPAGAKAPPDG